MNNADFPNIEIDENQRIILNMYTASMEVRHGDKSMVININMHDYPYFASLLMKGLSPANLGKILEFGSHIYARTANTPDGKLKEQTEFLASKLTKLEKLLTIGDPRKELKDPMAEITPGVFRVNRQGKSLVVHMNATADTRVSAETQLIDSDGVILVGLSSDIDFDTSADKIKVICSCSERMLASCVEICFKYIDTRNSISPLANNNREVEQLKSRIFDISRKLEESIDDLYLEEKKTIERVRDAFSHTRDVLIKAHTCVKIEQQCPKCSEYAIDLKKHKKNCTAYLMEKSKQRQIDSQKIAEDDVAPMGTVVNYVCDCGNMSITARDVLKHMSAGCSENDPIPEEEAVDIVSKAVEKSEYSGHCDWTDGIRVPVKDINDKLNRYIKKYMEKAAANDDDNVD